MSERPGGEEDEGERLRKVASRAIRRLDILEFVILGAAALLAVLAGGLMAYLLSSLTPLPLRATWIVASLLCFVVPAAIAWWRNRDPTMPDPPEPPTT